MQNDMVTLLLTSTLLVAGGLGIYLWKSNDDDGDDDNLGDNNDINQDDYNDDNNDDYSDDKPVQKKGAVKTRRSRKRHTGTKRRYNY